jgi:hypothetical protein
VSDRFAPVHYRKTLQGFQPVSSAAREFHAKTAIGKTVELKGRRPRNPRHHAKLFALLGLVVDNTELFASTDDALVGLKAVMGRGRWERIKGTTKDLFYPESISFDAMDQDEFEGFYDAAIAAVQRWWLPVADNDLREAIEAFAA